ncbi:MAG: ABC transporter ATP-binding protein [Clostridia bacterium]|nr:ABC transporter ATP-binding protein [Clostridia bacterium]
MKKLLVYLKEYRKESILGPLFKLLEATFELIVPMIMAIMIDQGIEKSNQQMIIKMAGVLVLLALVGLVCSITAQFFAAKAAVGFSKKVRHILFEHIGSLSYDDIDRIGTDTMIVRMTSDMNQVQNGINLTLRLLLRSPFVVFGAMIMAFFIDVRSALVFAVTIPVLSVIVFLIIKISIPLYKHVQTKLEHVLEITRENLIGVRVIRAFCKEKDEIEEFTDRNDELTQIQKFVGRISGFMNPVTYIVINFAIVVLLYVGALRVDSGMITQGAVVALYSYMSQILIELIKLANLIINITKAIASGNRIQSLLDITPNVNHNALALIKPATKMKGEIEFSHVSFYYHEEEDMVLTDLNFKIEAGQTLGIIGGTGAGKSTVINLLCGFYQAKNGKILIDRYCIEQYPTEYLREQIGIVPQKAVLFKGTIRENLLWGNEQASDDDLMKALCYAQADAFVLEKEGGLDYLIEQGGSNLSGGQRQRLTIARALVKNPAVLILDDSSSALDYATDAAMRRAIANMPKRPTTIIVSQRTSSLKSADQIIVLEDGRIDGIGTHEELLKHCPIYKEIYDSQYKVS